MGVVLAEETTGRQAIGLITPCPCETREDFKLFHLVYYIFIIKTAAAAASAVALAIVLPTIIICRYDPDDVNKWMRLYKGVVCNSYLAENAADGRQPGRSNGGTTSTDSFHDDVKEPARRCVYNRRDRVECCQDRCAPNG